MALSGRHGRDGHEEVLGEQLRVREEERDEADAEGEAREQVVARGREDGQQRHDAQTHLESAEEARDEHRADRPVQALGTLLDGGVEGLLQLVLDGGVAVAELSSALVTRVRDFVLGGPCGGAGHDGLPRPARLVGDEDAGTTETHSTRVAALRPGA